MKKVFSLSTDVAYSLTFKTGDMQYAGTDANVTLQLFGDKGQTEKIMLRQESGKTLKRFDRGRTDRFTVQTMDVGKVSNKLKQHYFILLHLHVRLLHPAMDWPTCSFIFTHLGWSVGKSRQDECILYNCQNKFMHCEYYLDRSLCQVMVHLLLLKNST